ncbi:MAG: hypothetical protein H6Q16_801 [Bacteroidetes bacterium]|nr:hypothetical protein [Bacteroidota bacterium]
MGQEIQIIIGKECAIDAEMNREHYLRDIVHNADDWKNNIKNNTSCENVDNWLHKQNPRYNPLYPYKGQEYKKRSIDKNGNTRAKTGTSATWYNYQKLFNLIMDTTENSKISFHEYCFTTELSQLPGKRSNDIDENDRINSIKKRSKLFSKDFFQQFPIVIVACGHYVRDYNINIEEIFNVKWQGNTIDIDQNWMNVHYQVSGNPKLLIHTNQLSMNISDKLLTKIAEECTTFINKKNITL